MFIVQADGFNKASTFFCQLPKYADQGTFNCAFLESGIGESGNPRRKWEEMGEREREREGGREKVLKSVATQLRSSRVQ